MLVKVRRDQIVNESVDAVLVEGYGWMDKDIVDIESEPSGPKPWSDRRLEAEEKYLENDRNRLGYLESQLRRAEREYEEAKDRFATHYVRLKKQEEVIAKQRAMRPAGVEPVSEDATFAADHSNITVFEGES